MNIFETIGTIYVVLATACFTAATIFFTSRGINQTQERYARGHAAELGDLCDAQAVRAALSPERD